MTIAELQEKIKQYRADNQFLQIDLKFTNRYDREYSIGTYKKGDKYYLRQSTAQSCIVTPDLQNYMKNTSKNAQDKKPGASIGTAVHKLIEAYFNNTEITALNALQDACKINGIEVEDSYLDDVKNCFNGFMMLREKTGMTWIASELTVASDQIDVAGTIDCIAEINGKFHIVDFKSGSVANGVKTESQLSFYKLAMEEIFGVPFVCTVFHLKKDGDSFHWTYNNYDMSLRSFLGALAVYSVDQWKQLKTFWKPTFENLFKIEHKKFEKQ